MGLLDEAFRLSTDSSLLCFIHHLFKCPENLSDKLRVCSELVLYIEDTDLSVILWQKCSKYENILEIKESTEEEGFVYLKGYFIWYFIKMRFFTFISKLQLEHKE